jgi:ornithine cyclodeaminase
MRIIALTDLLPILDSGQIIDCMRAALSAHSRGECDTPMPMHLEIESERAEVHIKSSYRRGGKYFALKVASTFPNNIARGLSSGNGMMLLCCANSGAPLACLVDNGHLTDVRTAAVAALVARELKRADSCLGILGTGIQARLQAQFHSTVLGLKRIVVWGRSTERVQAFQKDLAKLLPNIETIAVETPRDVAVNARLIVTTTAARAPLLFRNDIAPGTHISAVGADSVGKQELDAAILRSAALLLVDSSGQCERLGELQHALDQRSRAIEAGTFLDAPAAFDRNGITVADFTGLGVEDLFVAEYCFSRLEERQQ